MRDSKRAGECYMFIGFFSVYREVNREKIKNNLHFDNKSEK